MSAQPSAHARQVAREAAHWLTLLESGGAREADHAELQRWRARSSDHEQAWQKAQALRQRFAQLPGALALASLDRPDLGRRTTLKRMLALGALAPAGWLAWRQMPIANWSADLRTATGERRSLELPDGTRLQLNTASAVNLDFTDGRHQLALVDGEIALDGASELQVQTRDGRLQASGARFCVRQFDHGCLVSVARGTVRLEPVQGMPVTLQAGQRAGLGASAVGRVEAFDTRQPDWQQGVLIVENRGLGAVLRELDRYRPGVLRWDPALETLAVTGTFRLEDTDKALALLAASLPIEVHYRTRYWVSLVPRQSPA
ncbi:FecR domain-containing protein [Pseudomonas sp. TUM22785]|uniref:FecR domain-containing protein n=1 Tax=Pseudomonas sp. TUM22785 TaxID=3019098 RepID=UPI0023069A32|nr:FecR domain-containing protein [Pseudomonas sp. TUM22785]WCD81468.1 FecR domain-containing protein [Pseudomonas sp. TUM22785]